MVLEPETGIPDGGGDDGTPKLWVNECLLRSQFLRKTLPQEAHQCPALAESFAAFSAFKRFLLAVYIPEIQEDTLRFKSYV
ncbi:hypothetical protein ALC57_15172 [Trachymyrmex cornetzi]|uniref:Uncharacterized protein n=1 Tax=Trachymyrmex cornetzi TaxID=471704 RepID=A0A195DHX6_9HYME|nr:hypothetical protein ALC57_15172 [Trachymyrmex cornetzi]